MLVRTFQTFGFTLGRQRNALMIAANSWGVSAAMSAFLDMRKGTEIEQDDRSLLGQTTRELGFSLRVNSAPALIINLGKRE